MNRYHPSRHQRGFSLAEILITLLVMGIGLVALAKFQGGLLQGSDLAKQRTVAANLAQDKMEELRNFETVTGSSASYSSIASGTDTQTVGNATFTITSAITSNTNPTYKTANVTVSWTDQDNVGQSVNLVSQISDNAPELSGGLLKDPTEIEPLIPFPTASSAVVSSGGGGDSTEEDTSTDGSGTDTGTGTGTESGGDSGGDTTTPTYYTLTISGSITVAKTPATVVFLSASEASGSEPMGCTFTQSSYICTAELLTGTTWSGSVSITTDKVVCDPPGDTATFTNLSEGDSPTFNFVISKLASHC